MDQTLVRSLMIRTLAHAYSVQRTYLFRYVSNFWSLAWHSLDILHLVIAQPPKPELGVALAFHP